jgi:hypothetical protein
VLWSSTTADYGEPQKIEGITALLRKVHEVLDADKIVAKAIPFNVSEKGASSARRHQAILNYRGPDVETCRTLEYYHHHWLLAPQHFWDGRETDSFQVPHLRPEAKIVGRYVSLRRGDV